MADQLYALSGDDVALLRQMATAYRSGELGRPLQLAKRPLPERCNILFGVADSGIPGTAGVLTDPGSGTLSVHRFTSTGGTYDSGLDITAYNVSSIAVTSDEFTICVRDYESGYYLAVPISDGDGNLWYVGKTTGAISAGGSGTAELYTSGWTASGTYFTVSNPHDIELPSGLKIRWTNAYYGWSGWIAEPWQWTECPPDGSY